MARNPLLEGLMAGLANAWNRQAEARYANRDRQLALTDRLAQEDAIYQQQQKRRPGEFAQKLAEDETLYKKQRERKLQESEEDLPLEIARKEKLFKAELPMKEEAVRREYALKQELSKLRPEVQQKLVSGDIQGAMALAQTEDEFKRIMMVQENMQRGKALELQAKGLAMRGQRAAGGGAGTPRGRYFKNPDGKSWTFVPTGQDFNPDAADSPDQEVDPEEAGILARLKEIQQGYVPKGTPFLAWTTPRYSRTDPNTMRPIPDDFAAIRTEARDLMGRLKAIRSRPRQQKVRVNPAAESQMPPMGGGMRSVLYDSDNQPGISGAMDESHLLQKPLSTGSKVDINSGADDEFALFDQRKKKKQGEADNRSRNYFDSLTLPGGGY